MYAFIWRIEDYEGVEVALEHAVWHDKILHPLHGHPEVKEYLDAIRLSVQAPEAVFASIRDPRSKLFYRSDLMTGRFARHWLVVVVKYVKEARGLKGYISTSFISRELKKGGDRLWPKSAS